MLYIEATTNYGLFYEYGNKIELAGYIDTNWVGCAYDRRSTNGDAFTLVSVVVSWSSRNQTKVAFSSTKA